MAIKTAIEAQEAWLRHANEDWFEEASAKIDEMMTTGLARISIVLEPTLNEHVVFISRLIYHLEKLGFCVEETKQVESEVGASGNPTVIIVKAFRY